MKLKLFLTAIIICITLTMHSQDTASFNYTPWFSAVIVDKLDSSVKWYQSVFGLKVTKQINEPATGFKVVILESFTFLIELIENKSSLAIKEILVDKPAETKVQGLFKIGFHVFDMDVCIKHLLKLGIPVGTIYKEAISGKRNFLVNDPDGNLIQFFE